MLPPEIAPFADHHIEKLNSLIDNIDEVHPAGVLTLTPEELKAWRKDLREAARGFMRFKICMADEAEQKERYRKYAMKHGYPFS